MPSATVFGSDPRFYWNLDHDVGPGCVNNTEDVELIQFAYFCMGSNRLPVDPTLMAFAAKIVPGEPYDGKTSNKLSQCISRH